MNSNVLIGFPPSRRKKIAIVDDGVLMRRGLTEIINSFPNYSVLFEAEDGEDFIKKINNENLPDIVLLDTIMPKMDGYSTAKWISINYPNIQIIALGNTASEMEEIKIKKCGAQLYIPKNASIEELKQALNKC